MIPSRPPSVILIFEILVGKMKKVRSQGGVHHLSSEIPRYFPLITPLMLNELQNKIFKTISNIARSSNGRTSDFGSDCVGSNPARATKLNPLPRGGFFLFMDSQAWLELFINRKSPEPHFLRLSEFSLLSPS